MRDPQPSTLEFCFDVSSPWTYLAFSRIEALCAEAGARLVWRPILVGGVFNAVNPEVYETRARPNPRKVAYQAKDLADWARHRGLRIVWPPTVFPVNSVKAMRALLAAQERDAETAGPPETLPALARRLFEAYWGEDRDISQTDVLAECIAAVGLDADALLARIGAPEIKARLRENTDDLIRRGGFGSPTMFVNGDDLYFGNDRLPLVREAFRAAAGGG